MQIQRQILPLYSLCFYLLWKRLTVFEEKKAKKGNLLDRNGYWDPFIKKIYNETHKSNESLWSIQKSIPKRKRTVINIQVRHRTPNKKHWCGMVLRPVYTTDYAAFSWRRIPQFTPAICTSSNIFGRKKLILMVSILINM